MSLSSHDEAERREQRRATEQRALPARRRTPMVWIGIASAIAIVFIVVFTLALVL